MSFRLEYSPNYYLDGGDIYPSVERDESCWFQWKVYPHQLADFNVLFLQSTIDFIESDPNVRTLSISHVGQRSYASDTGFIDHRNATIEEESYCLVFVHYADCSIVMGG